MLLLIDAVLQMTNRKSSILNRVRTMNLNKIYCLNNKSSSNGESSNQQQSCESSESSESTHVQQKQLPIIKQSHHQQGEPASEDSGVKCPQACWLEGMLVTSTMRCVRIYMDARSDDRKEGNRNSQWIFILKFFFSKNKRTPLTENNNTVSFLQFE